MPITAPQATTDAPGVSLVNIGDSFKWALVDVDLYDVKVFGSDELTGKKGYAITVLVIEPGQAVTGNQTDGYTPVASDSLVTIYCSSYGKWDPDRDPTTAPYKSWGGCTEDLELVEGLIGEWKFIEELKPSKPGISGRKDRKFRLRQPTADEQHIVARCLELNAAKNAEATATGPQTGGSTGNGAPLIDEEPFVRDAAIGEL